MEEKTSVLGIFSLRRQMIELFLSRYDVALAMCVCVEEILWHGRVWECMSLACKILGSDRAVILCISWKGYLYYLSLGLEQLDWFHDAVKLKK